MISFRQLLLTAGSVAFVTGATAYCLGRTRKSPLQRERERRKVLSAAGRITDGTVLDVRETETDGQQQQFLIYGYDVGGVRVRVLAGRHRAAPVYKPDSCRRGASCQREI